MAKSNVADYSTTAASNTDIDGVDSTGATGLVKSGDNYVRSLMAHLAKFYDDFGGVNTVLGTGDAITITTSTTYTALATGMRFRFKASAVNTGAVTLNLDAIGAKAVRKIIAGTDVALAAGDITNARSYDVVYDATANAAAGAWIIQPSKVAAPDGTAALPGFYFDADTDSGFSRIGANNVGLSLGGATILDFRNTAVIPTTNNNVALGDGAHGFFSLNLGSGAIVSWNSADITLTQSSGVLALSGNSAALLDLSASVAGQIKFPASQNASANANTLDDYEEGTFTPTMTFNASSTGVTYSVQTGNYIKIGQLVYVYGRITLTSNGTGVGTARIASLPFTSANSGATNPGKIRLIVGGSAATGIYAYVELNAATATLIIPGATGDVAATDTNCTDTFSCDFALAYQAAA